MPFSRMKNLKAKPNHQILMLICCFLPPCFCRVLQRLRGKHEEVFPVVQMHGIGMRGLTWLATGELFRIRVHINARTEHFLLYHLLARGIILIYRLFTIYDFFTDLSTSISTMNSIFPLLSADFAMDSEWMVPLQEAVSAALGGAYVVNVAVGSSPLHDYLNTYFMTMNEQVEM